MSILLLLLLLLLLSSMLLLLLLLLSSSSSSSSWLVLQRSVSLTAPLETTEALPQLLNTNYQGLPGIIIIKIMIIFFFLQNEFKRVKDDVLKVVSNNKLKLFKLKNNDIIIIIIISYDRQTEKKKQTKKNIHDQEASARCGSINP